LPRADFCSNFFTPQFPWGSPEYSEFPANREDGENESRARLLQGYLHTTA
jgi:hypothetical protein